MPQLETRSRRLSRSPSESDGTIDSHTPGEPTRLVVGGVAPARQHVNQKRDHFKSRSMRSGCG